MKTLNKDLAAVQTTLESVQLSQVIEAITDTSIEDTIMIYNDYASHNGYEQVFSNDEHTINDLFLTPYDAIRQTNNKDYKDYDSFFTFNGYGHAVSFDYRLSENSPIDISELAEWLISEDKLADYDITVTTLEDMLASIEDNITDDEVLLKTAINYLGVSTMINGNDKVTDYNQYLINSVMEEIRYTDYETVKSVIDRLGINYQ